MKPRETIRMIKARQQERNKERKKERQVGAELCQAQFKLGPAKQALP